MLEKINTLKEQIEALTASNAEEIEALRIKYLSKKGEVSALFNDFRICIGCHNVIFGVNQF